MKISIQTRFPRIRKFPYFERDMDTVELIKLCTGVLNDFGDIVDEFDPSVRAALTGGTPSERIDALHKVRIANRDRNTKLLDQYFVDLEAERLVVIDEPVVVHLPQEVHVGLAIKAERDMSREAKDELVRAMSAVYNAIGGPKPWERTRSNPRHAAARAKRNGGALGIKTPARTARVKSKGK